MASGANRGVGVRGQSRLGACRRGAATCSGWPWVCSSCLGAQLGVLLSAGSFDSLAKALLLCTVLWINVKSGSPFWGLERFKRRGAPSQQVRCHQALHLDQDFSSRFERAPSQSGFSDPPWHWADPAVRFHPRRVPGLSPGMPSPCCAAVPMLIHGTEQRHQHCCQPG